MGNATKHLFDPTLVEDVKRRVLCLRPQSQPHWGKMPVAQAIAHCTSGFQMATGSIQARRASFPASILGLLIKPVVLGDDKPMRRNSPSAPELFTADPDQCEFERERAELVGAIDSFAAAGPACCTEYPHPFFGRLTPQQWSILMYKHVDHHLRQFGA